MTTQKEKRSSLGYGSTYKKGDAKDANPTEIKTVLGGQTWKVKPDKSAHTSNPCIWMQAGLVKYKDCNNFYDCTTCKYDLGMSKKVEKGNGISWQDAMRKKPYLNRVCRHSLTNRIEQRACAYDYQCAKCDFDQFFEDVWTTKNKTVPGEIQQIKGFDVPVGYYFHNGHTWARIESGGYIRIGLDDFSLKLLGRADALELPLIGKEFDQGAVGWGLRRKDNMADVLSPVDGVIVEVNANVREKPEIANHEPYGDGWLFMVRSPDIKETVKKLMDDTAGLSWISEEVVELERMVEKVAGPLAADGGYFMEDIYGNLPGLDWKNLTKTFLKT
ncbi:glycine cleavage system protein H [Desulfobacterium sp. N47]|uniref:glycine cleavage system protein H n=1 Tax=Desulfobacterium sp. N47 TaxID=3115210 RepID=UPI003CBE372E